MGKATDAYEIGLRRRRTPDCVQHSDRGAGVISHSRSIPRM